MRIYVASSWRNERQPAVVEALRAAGHEVYDFRHPAPGNTGFDWAEIDPNWQNWTPAQFAIALEHQVAHDGFMLDKTALDECDACVLVLPCGRSAHLEAGYAAGQGKPVRILLTEDQPPKLMYLLTHGVATSIESIVSWAATVKAPKSDTEQGFGVWDIMGDLVAARSEAEAVGYYMMEHRISWERIRDDGGAQRLNDLDHAKIRVDEDEKAPLVPLRQAVRGLTGPEVVALYEP